MKVLILVVLLGLVFTAWAKISASSQNAKKEQQRLNRNAKARDKRSAAKQEARYAGVDEAYKRKPIPKSIREETLSDEDVSCIYCGAKKIESAPIFHLDHLIPVTRGGTNASVNLYPSCARCNLEKSNSHPIDYIMFKFLRYGVLTKQSIELIKMIIAGHFSKEVTVPNRNWWKERIETSKELLRLSEIDMTQNLPSKISIGDKQSLFK